MLSKYIYKVKDIHKRGEMGYTAGMAQPLTFIFIGRSGCGKGTQAALIQKWLENERTEHSVVYVETGARIRELGQGETFSGRLSREINDVGGLQPAFVPVWAWSTMLIEHMTGREHLIFDGTPRKENEARILNSALHFYQREKPYFVYLNVSEAWARERLLARHRSDDAKDAIDMRMRWFETDVLPAINYFRDREGYHFLDINGEQSIENVHDDIVANIQ